MPAGYSHARLLRPQPVFFPRTETVEKAPLLSLDEESTTPSYPRHEGNHRFHRIDDDDDEDQRPSVAEASRLLLLLVFAAIWTGLAVFLTPLTPTATRRTIGWVLVGIWALLTLFLGARLGIEAFDLWRERRMRARGRRLLVLGGCEKLEQV